MQRLTSALRERPNWVVYVADDSRSERFTTAAGAPVSGFEAVKHAVGTLYNRTSFGDLTDPRNDETNGCIFALTLADKGMSLYLGDSYRSAGLDADDARLFGAARTALRRGLRVADAVIGTIAAVEARKAKAARATDAAAKRSSEPSVPSPAEAPRRSPERREAPPPRTESGGLVVVADLAGDDPAVGGGVDRPGAHTHAREPRSRPEAPRSLARRVPSITRPSSSRLRKWGEILASNPLYVGKTDQLADSVVEDVRHVMAIRASALAAMDDAQDLIEPKGVLSRMNSFLVSGNHNRAARLLTDQPIPFDPETALGRMLTGCQGRRGQPAVERDPQDRTANADLRAARARAGRASRARGSKRAADQEVHEDRELDARGARGPHRAAGHVRRGVRRESGRRAGGNLAGSRRRVDPEAA